MRTTNTGEFLVPRTCRHDCNASVGRGVLTPAALGRDGKRCRAKRFVEYYEASVRPLEIEAAKLFWTANITGKEEDYQKKQEAEEKLDVSLSEPQRFAELKAIKQARGPDDRTRADPSGSCPSDRRALSRNICPSSRSRSAEEDVCQIERRGAGIQRVRPKAGGKELTEQRRRRTCVNQPIRPERPPSLEAGKKVGPVVVGDLLELVALRTRPPGSWAFKNLPRYATLLRRAKAKSSAQAV